MVNGFFSKILSTSCYGWHSKKYREKVTLKMYVILEVADIFSSECIFQFG